METNEKFKYGDVIVEIGNEKRLFWIVREIVESGYYSNVFFDGKLYVTEYWISFQDAHDGMIKVDEWDDENNRMKNVEEE